MEHITREEAYDLLKKYNCSRMFQRSDRARSRAAWLGIRQAAHNDFGNNESYGR